MKVYFAASTSGIPKFGKEYRYIARTIRGLGITVLKNWFVAKLQGKELYKNSDELFKGETSLLAQADFLVAEVAMPSFGVGYAIRQALDQRKPVLCLYPNSMDPTLVSDAFLGSTSNLLRVDFYDGKNLRQVLRSNIAAIQSGGLAKFNFLITPEITAYLDWATRKTRKSKSEFLREVIVKGIIQKDKEYQESVAREKKKGK